MSTEEKNLFTEYLFFIATLLLSIGLPHEPISQSLRFLGLTFWRSAHCNNLFFINVKNPVYMINRADFTPLFNTPRKLDMF